MVLTFLDDRVAAIDATVQAAMHEAFGDAHAPYQERADLDVLLAAIARDIVARRVRTFSGLAMGDFLTFAADDFAYERSLGIRRKNDATVMPCEVIFSISAGGALNASRHGAGPFVNKPLRELIEEFHRGEDLEIPDGHMFYEHVTIPALRLSIADRRRRRPGTVTASGDYATFVGEELPSHGNALVTLLNKWKSVQEQYYPGETSDALAAVYRDAAVSIVEHYRDTQQGLHVPDEGLVIGYFDKKVGQPIRLYPDGNVYIQLPLLQKRLSWRRRLVMVHPSDYKAILGSDLETRSTLLREGFSPIDREKATRHDVERRGLRGDRRTVQPMDYVSQIAYFTLRRFAAVDMTNGIEPADQTKLWVNGGRPANLISEYVSPLEGV